MTVRRHPLLLMVSPLVAWALHFVVVYALVGLHCGAPPEVRSWLSAGGLGAGLVASTLAVTLALAWLARDGWLRRRAAAARGDGDDDGDGGRGNGSGNGDRGRVERERFCASVQLGLVPLSLLAVAFTVFPTLLLEGCR